jgi:hypothetical protein
MPNSPFPGGPKEQVKRDEPNKSGGARHGNQGADRVHGDLVGPGLFADQPDDSDEGLVRGPPPKPRKRYSQAG